jgi:PEP-CTERM motif
MKLSKWAGAAALGLAAVGGPAEASVVIDVSEVGGNVVTTGSGTIDLAGLSFFEFAPPGQARMVPALADMIVGSAPDSQTYTGATGPASFGTGGLAYASSASGDIIAVEAGIIEVPFGYVSGTALSGAATYDGQTFASLGLTPGTYVYAWGSGPTADSLTVKIAIPEPATRAMILLGFAALGVAGFHAARKSVAISA